MEETMLIDNDMKNLTYENLNNYLSSVKYDNKGRIIYCQNSCGEDIWYGYDKNGFINHCKKSSGYEEWFDYDDDGNIIHYKNTNNIEEWNLYDENNNCIYYKNSYGVEKYIRYTDNGKIYVKGSNENNWHEFDENDTDINSL